MSQRPTTNDQRPTTNDQIWRGLFAGVACAAVIYAKQPAWFLYPALALDAAVLHRHLFRKLETWIAVATIVVLCLPLALFTLKFGHANLAQSVGNNTQLIMGQYHALARWSLASWLFYPRMAWTSLNPVVVVLACAALILAVARPGFRRNNLLWLAWLFFAYLTFSFYDNKSWRHATFWWPAWIALAAACIQFAVRRLAAESPRSDRPLSGFPSPLRLATIALPALLLLPIPWQLRHDLQQNYTEYRGQRSLVVPLFAGPVGPGNILLFGDDKQTFIALIREYDTGRRSSVLRGDALLDTAQTAGGPAVSKSVNPGSSIPELCREYQIRTILVEAPPSANDRSTAAEIRILQTDPAFTSLETGSFLLKRSTVPVLVFRYNGPVNPTMADVPLSNRLL